jgi:hypothetical protein
MLYRYRTSEWRFADRPELPYNTVRAVGDIPVSFVAANQKKSIQLCFELARRTEYRRASR